MEKYAILLGYYDKQWGIIQKLHEELICIDLSVYELRYVFALKTQQLYTAIEDLLKQIAKAFENLIEDLSASHKELLVRLHIEIPNIRPQVISEKSYLLLDKVRAFQHFILYAYDCELEEGELQEIQNKLKLLRNPLEQDFETFKQFVKQLG